MLAGIARELIGLFVDDGMLAVAIIAVPPMPSHPDAAVLPVVAPIAAPSLISIAASDSYVAAAAARLAPPSPDVNGSRRSRWAPG